MKPQVILYKIFLVLVILFITNSMPNSFASDYDNWFKKLAGNVLWKLEVSGTFQILKELGMSKRQIEQFAISVAECMYQNKSAAYNQYWRELSKGNGNARIEDFIDIKENNDIDNLCSSKYLKTLPVEHNIFKD